MRRAPILKYSGKSEYGFFFGSDVHSDDNDFDERLFFSDIERAVSKDMRVLLGGDLFSLILPKDFKRFTSSRGKTKDGKPVEAYLNNAVFEAEERLSPFVDVIDCIGTGNHESSVIKFNGVDPIQLLVALLNRKRSKKLPPIYQLGYKGFIYLDCERYNKTNRVVVWYDHGRGGGAAVTKGMIDMNRTLAGVEGFDIAWLQHKHVRWADAGISRYTPGPTGKPKTRKLIGMITGSYQKDVVDDGDLKDGYVIHFGEERATAPQGTGGISITVIPYNTKINGETVREIDYDISIRR